MGKVMMRPQERRELERHLEREQHAREQLSAEERRAVAARRLDELAALFA